MLSLRDNNWSESLNLTSKKETPLKNKFTQSTLRQRKSRLQFQRSFRNWKSSQLKLTNLKSIKIPKTKFWINLIKISRESVTRKSNIGMKKISLENKRMNSTINTTTLWSNIANSNIFFKISNGWPKWKLNFKNQKTTEHKQKLITKKELPTEKQEKKKKREEMKNGLKRKRIKSREKLKQKKMLSRTRDKMKLINWINLMLSSMIQVSRLVLWPLKFNNVMRF